MPKANQWSLAAIRLLLINFFLHGKFLDHQAKDLDLLQLPYVDLDEIHHCKMVHVGAYEFIPISQWPKTELLLQHAPTLHNAVAR